MAKNITIKSFPKVNLCLDVIEKTPSGYHKIKSVLHLLDAPFDLLRIFETDQKDDLSIIQAPQNFDYPIANAPQNLQSADNLVFKALRLLKSRFKITKNIKITIQKNIPVSAGLGGGSSNAAATLHALNHLWSLNLTPPMLQQLAAEIGMDVPFFITGGTAIATNFGEKITPLPHLKLPIRILPPASWPKSLLNTAQNQKTAFMYQNLELQKCAKNQHLTSKLILAIQNNQLPEIPRFLHNDFATLYVELPKGLHLSGSGPALFSFSPEDSLV